MNKFNFKIIYWTSTKHLGSSETSEMKSPVLNSNNLDLRVYKVSLFFWSNLF